MMKQKILLVGDSRICSQVAYVMDWQDYEQVEQLTDAAKYHDYKIVACVFKKKSKRLVRIKDKAFCIIYLDDICRELDAEGQRTFLLPKSIVDKPVPLWRRVIDRVKTGEVGLAIIRRWRRRVTLHNFHIINKLPIKFLRLSELFIKVLYSKPSKIVCNVLETMCFVDDCDGNVKGCCFHRPDYLSLGNAKNGLATVYNSPRARIFRLSSINKSLCLCDELRCSYSRYLFTGDDSANRRPAYIELGLDRSCNLACPQCRNEHFTEPTLTDDMKVLVEAINQNGWLNEIKYLRLAGAGEVFYSKLNLHLLENVLHRDQILIQSNGILFDEHNWQKLKNYKTIDVTISIDAATAVTYRKLRGGDFNKLMQNLTMLGELRKKGEIRYFQLNFVVQRDNYREMAEVVHLAKKLFVDRVYFIKLNNWGTFTEREYRKKCLIVRHRRLHRDLQRVLQDPIFRDPIVDLMAFSRYIKNFAQKFPQSLRDRTPYEW